MRPAGRTLGLDRGEQELTQDKQAPLPTTAPRSVVLKGRSRTTGRQVGAVGVLQNLTFSLTLSPVNLTFIGP